MGQRRQMAPGCLLGRGPSPKERRGARWALAASPAGGTPRVAGRVAAPAPPPQLGGLLCPAGGWRWGMPGHPLSSRQGGMGKSWPPGWATPALPPFCRGAQTRLGGYPGPAPASPAALVRRHAQSPWRPAPLILLKMMLIFWAGPRGDAGDPRTFASCLHPPPIPSPGSIHTGVWQGLLWVSPRSGCWVIQHRCSFTQ